MGVDSSFILSCRPPLVCQGSPPPPSGGPRVAHQQPVHSAPVVGTVDGWCRSIIWFGDTGFTIPRLVRQGEGNWNHFKIIWGRFHWLAASNGAGMWMSIDGVRDESMDYESTGFGACVSQVWSSGFWSMNCNMRVWGYGVWGYGIWKSEVWNMRVWSAGES